ncbi:MAG: BspA family leucine-rich repeat surface protein [Prevotella sp.]|nr:BspA family leucine-rich repeat surface protein [Prevotella sp.]
MYLVDSKVMLFRVLLSLLLFLPSEASPQGSYKRWDVFTAKTVEGIEMKFCVADTEKKECHVGANDGKPAITGALSGNLTIPSEVNGFTVTRIGPSAFMRKGITSVVIPETITSVGSGAFQECEALESVIIPNSVAEIGSYAFKDCFKLQTVVLSNQLKVIESGLFERCWELKSISIPSSVTTIYNNAFYACSKIETLLIPASVTQIGKDAFSSCSGLTSIVVEDGNPVYDSRNQCNAIIETATNKLLWGCQNTIIIPEGVTSIEPNAFYYCQNLKSIVIPSTVASIGKWAFLGCESLESVTSYIKKPFTQDELPSCAATLYVPEGTLDRYKVTSSWNTFTTIKEIEDTPATETEAYAVLSPDGKTLTFYYDDKVATREGKVFLSYNFRAEEKNGWWYTRESYGIYYKDITTVVFDDSFANYEGLTSTAYWFHNLTDLTTVIGLENLKTDNVTNMSHMFSYCPLLTSLDIEALNTSKVTDMSNMFSYCYGLKTLDVSKFNTSNVTNMNYMFSGCSGIAEIDVSHFNTSNVKSMSEMFSGCSLLTTLDLSGFDLSKTKNTIRMFVGCKNLTTIYASQKWNSWYSTAEAHNNSGGMFSSCTSIVGGKGTIYDSNRDGYLYARIDEGISRPGYFTDKNAEETNAVEAYAVLNSEQTTLTFYYDNKKKNRKGTLFLAGNFRNSNNFGDNGWYNSCEVITTVVFDKSFSNYEELTDLGYWFAYCKNLTSIVDIEYLKTPNVKNMMGMFISCRKLTSLDVSHFNTAKVSNMSMMFFGCEGLKSLDVRNFDVSKVSDMSSLFQDCSGLTNIDVSNFKTTNVKNMGSMFENCSGLTSLDVSLLDTRNVWNMTAMFCGCSGLTTLDLRNFDTSNVTVMERMFHKCKKLTIINLSSFNTSKVNYVTDMQSMFQDCSALEVLDLSSFNTSTVTNMSVMFRGCSNLKTIYVSSGWKTNTVSKSSYMFYDCKKLVGGDGTIFDSNYIDKTKAYAGEGGYLTFANQQSGDLNGDREIDVTDVVELIDMVLSGSTDPSGDINGDGEVDVTDVVELIDMVLGN